MIHNSRPDQIIHCLHQQWQTWLYARYWTRFARHGIYQVCVCWCRCRRGGQGGRNTTISRRRWWIYQWVQSKANSCVVAFSYSMCDWRGWMLSLFPPLWPYRDLSVDWALCLGRFGSRMYDSLKEICITYHARTERTTYWGNFSSPCFFTVQSLHTLHNRLPPDGLNSCLFSSIDVRVVNKVSSSIWIHCRKCSFQRSHRTLFLSVVCHRLLCNMNADYNVGSQ